MEGSTSTASKQANALLLANACAFYFHHASLSLTTTQATANPPSKPKQPTISRIEADQQ
jgi:hypothetical protein